MIKIKLLIFTARGPKPIAPLTNKLKTDFNIQCWLYSFDCNNCPTEKNVVICMRIKKNLELVIFFSELQQEDFVFWLNAVLT